MVLSYFVLNWAAEIKKLKKSNFEAAVFQNYASESVKQEQFHKSQVKSDIKKNFFLFFIFRLVVLSWTCPYIYTLYYYNCFNEPRDFNVYLVKIVTFCYTVFGIIAKRSLVHQLRKLLNVCWFHVYCSVSFSTRILKYCIL